MSNTQTFAELRDQVVQDIERVQYGGESSRRAASGALALARLVRRQQAKVAEALPLVKQVLEAYTNKKNGVPHVVSTAHALRMLTLDGKVDRHEVLPDLMAAFGVATKRVTPFGRACPRYCFSLAEMMLSTADFSRGDDFRFSAELYRYNVGIIRVQPHGSSRIPSTLLTIFSPESKRNWAFTSSTHTYFSSLYNDKKIWLEDDEVGFWPMSAHTKRGYLRHVFALQDVQAELAALRGDKHPSVQELSKVLEHKRSEFTGLYGEEAAFEVYEKTKKRDLPQNRIDGMVWALGRYDPEKVAAEKLTPV